MELEVHVLVAEISRLENSIKHLEETQAELVSYLAEEGSKSAGGQETTAARLVRAGEGQAGLGDGVEEEREDVSGEGDAVGDMAGDGEVDDGNGQVREAVKENEGVMYVCVVLIHSPLPSTILVQEHGQADTRAEHRRKRG
jgi:hypothetical protein